jgi:preprotein translocase subunit YajC
VTTYATLALFQAPAGGGGFPIAIVVQIMAFAAIFYFLLIRPQRRMQQQHRDMVAALKKGDEIMTEGGLIGHIVHIAEDRLLVKSGDTRVMIARSKIARVFAEGAATEVKS